MFLKQSSLCGLFLCMIFANVHASFPYYGTKIGSLKRLHHGVSGDVYAVDSRTLFIKKFNYDGEAPAAYFYVGNTNKPSNEGAFRLRDERGSTTSLTRRYRNKDITLLLPEGKTLRDFKWFSVWCDEFAVNFGDVSIPNNLDYPRPQKIGALKGVHGVSSDNVVIVDAQTLLIPNFSYDGEAPDAKFWVGRGQKPTPNGLRIPDENGKENPLRRYDRKTIVLTLPDDLTIFDIGHFGVWCEAFTVDFGHVPVPEGLNVPPSLKMLGISPQSKLNCEVLYDDLAFEVRWAVAGESIVVQLVAKLDSNEYMSFGISPAKDRTQMIGADVVVAWVDKDTGKGYADDYYMDDKSQCSGGRGVCPERETNSIRLLNAAMVNGYSIVTYQRSLQATDKNDLPISVNGTESIVWAIGPLNERKEASFHSFFTKKPHFINFGRPPTWNCPMPDGSKTNNDNDNSEEDAADAEGKEHEEDRNVAVDGYPPKKDSEPEEEFYENRPQALQKPENANRRQETNVLPNRRPVPTPKPVNGNQAWDIPAIQCYEPEDGVFYAQMGPTGGKHGYSAITGHVGWGISWYINGLLIPEIHVVRGRTYTFVVEGGNNPDIPAKYHPFYITDDPIGGYEHKREEEKKAVRIFAGVHRSRSGQITPTGVGRLCNWTPDVDGPPADDYQSFGAYQRTLTLKCDDGEPGVITWKPDRNTPDTVYYHCFTHRYLGWKIHVHDSCEDPRYAASEKQEIRLPANIEDGLRADSSIRHETKVSPNDNFLLMHQKDLIKNHNMNGTPPKLTFELTKSSEITKLISDGIRAAEALEESILRNSDANQNQPKQKQKHGPVNPLYYEQPPSQYPTSKNQTVNNYLQTPPKLQLPTLAPVPAPEILQGESQINTQINRNTHHHHHHQKLPIYASNAKIISQATPPHHNHNQNHIQNHNHIHFHTSSSNFTNLPITAQKTIGLSEYLRPPQNAPLFHPVKLPGRRPNPIPLKKVSGIKPILPQQLARHPGSSQLVPQPSVIVNHYRRPIPSLLKPFLKEKPFPIEPIAASVLLLGQPTELNSQRKTEPLLHPKPKPIIPVPYKDSDSQGSLQHNAFVYNSIFKKEKKPPLPHREVPIPLPTTSSAPPTSNPLFKKPFEIHVVQEDLSNQIATNNGFKPDSVIVESGFKPIRREEGNVGDDIDQMANRREDPGSEIDEAMETDTLFITAQQNAQTQNFEPMFIPSPPDSTNNTINIRYIEAPLANIITKHSNPLSLPLTDISKNVESPLPKNANAQAGQKDQDVDINMDEDEDENEFDKMEQPQIFLTNVKPTKGNISTSDPVIEQNMEDDDEFYDFLEDFKDHELQEEEEDSTQVLDREAQAAERIDTYYLPPDNRKVPNSKIPSGAVVTYDGKSLIDSSIVLPPKLDTSEENNSRHHSFHISKAEQLVRTTPQFKPFTGEIPPDITEFLSTEKTLKTSKTPLTNFSTKSHSPTSSTPTLNVSVKPISTKLQLLKMST